VNRHLLLHVGLRRNDVDLNDGLEDCFVRGEREITNSNSHQLIHTTQRTNREWKVLSLTLSSVRIKTIHGKVCRIASDNSMDLTDTLCRDDVFSSIRNGSYLE